MALAPSGRLYVLDGSRDEVVRFSPAGEEDGRAGGRGWSGTGFDTPVDISAMNDLEIFVADYGNNRVVRLDPALSLGNEFRTEGTAPGFRYPLSVAQSGVGTLLIVDAEYGRIVELDQNRNVSRVFGGSGTGPGFLTRPSRVRVSGARTVYVLHEAGLATFDAYGNYLRTGGRALTGEFITFTLYRNTLFLLDTATVKIFDQYWNPLGLIPVPVKGPADIPVDIQVDGEWIYLLRSRSVERMKYTHPR